MARTPSYRRKAISVRKLTEKITAVARSVSRSRRICASSAGPNSPNASIKPRLNTSRSSGRTDPLSTTRAPTRGGHAGEDGGHEPRAQPIDVALHASLKSLEPEVEILLGDQRFPPTGWPPLDQIGRFRHAELLLDR